MKAIFEDRNRQYTVQVGDTIVIDKMANVEKDTEIVRLFVQIIAADIQTAHSTLHLLT